jgi:hypothetical protein
LSTIQYMFVSPWIYEIFWSIGAHRYSRVSCMSLFLYKISKNVQNLTEKKPPIVLERLDVK